MKKETISVQKMIEAGYRQYATGRNAAGNDMPKFQKRIDDEVGIRYFINANFITVVRITYWEFSVQMNTPHGAVNLEAVQWFNDNGKYSGNEIKDVEEYFTRFWEFNGKPYYEKR